MKKFLVFFLLWNTAQNIAEIQVVLRSSTKEYWFCSDSVCFRVSKKPIFILFHKGRSQISGQQVRKYILIKNHCRFISVVVLPFLTSWFPFENITIPQKKFMQFLSTPDNYGKCKLKLILLTDSSMIKIKKKTFFFYQISLLNFID